ncbi:unnamed protein product [Phytophthora lilii]|uniref:Unnamed protein product n=1 Tax=Phytophthora lilii TaxID=2077276 RepID=A0A9W6TV54_9STRA|nr:unnamed protein product [Phytophthora lilii]
MEKFAAILGGVANMKTIDDKIDALTVKAKELQDENLALFKTIQQKGYNLEKLHDELGIAQRLATKTEQELKHDKFFLLYKEYEKLTKGLYGKDTLARK